LNWASEITAGCIEKKKRRHVNTHAAMGHFGSFWQITVHMPPHKFEITARQHHQAATTLQNRGRIDEKVETKLSRANSELRN
jgi:hypothetical protein